MLQEEPHMGIYMNQLGYLPNARKVATATFPCNFQVIDRTTQHAVFDGVSIDSGMDASSGEHVYTLDFSALTQSGSYYILTGNGEQSLSFSVASDVYRQLQLDMSKCLYFQRCGCALTEKYAGAYTHAACHTEDAIFLSDYVKKTPNPPHFDMTGGWHDAGDFGRYISPAAVAVGHLLYAYELFPESFRAPLNIPETGNGIPDILNECRYELDWMLKMQASDGGVYHKLTSFVHADFLMPEEDKLQFLIYDISSMATADFAASMALASRVYAPFDSAFAQRTLDAARKAFDWMEKNPYTGFHNPAGSNTGEYDDDCDIDERLWACAELVRTDSEHRSLYLDAFRKYSGTDHPDVTKTDFGWTDVSGMAALCLLTDPQNSFGSELHDEYQHLVLQESDRLITLQQQSGYDLAMEPADFVWGSNMVVCNRSMLLILAALCSEETACEQYRAAALEQLHYLLGRNALNISYITGEGVNAYHNPHNRPTACDHIELPMPGWVSGGPFKTPCDPAAIAAIPKGTAPMKCYVDDIGSYSTNEITIYWNSPVIFMTAYFNSL